MQDIEKKIMTFVLCLYPLTDEVGAWYCCRLGCPAVCASPSPPPPVRLHLLQAADIGNLWMDWPNFAHTHLLGV